MHIRGIVEQGWDEEQEQMWLQEELKRARTPFFEISST